MALNTFSEKALVSVTPDGKGELKFQTKLETMSFGGGEKKVKFIPTIAGGRLKSDEPQDDFEVTLELILLEAGTATWPTAGSAKVGTGIHDVWDGVEDASQPLAVVLDQSKTAVRLTILCTDDTTATSAEQLVNGASKKAIRFSYADGYLTSLEPSWDGLLKTKAKFVFPAFDEDGVACSFFESSDDTTTASGAPLTILSNYTAGSATKFK